LIKKETARRINAQKPIKLIPKKPPEKISKKNPPKNPINNPDFLSGLSKRFKRITKIKIKFGRKPLKLK
jgi:hypothetical protein